MTFGGIFSSINLDSPITNVILLTNLIFLASQLEAPILNVIWSFLYPRDFKEMAKIIIKQNDVNFDRRKTLGKSTITFNYRIVDGHFEFPYCMLLFDKSNIYIYIYIYIIINNPPSLNLQSRDQNLIQIWWIFMRKGTIDFWIC